MDFSLSKEQDMVRLLFGNFAEKEIKDLAHTMRKALNWMATALLSSVSLKIGITLLKRSCPVLSQR
ncbi:MAG: hypothetical protein LBS86_01110 [Treponema sp.]|jgi:hypothetical protein|nr:hypothetical protein [Treponema sp.]